MNIQQPKTQEDFEEINQFFGSMWKEEFDLDRFDKIEEYKRGTSFCIKENNNIIGCIFFVQIKDYLMYIFCTNKRLLETTTILNTKTS